MDDKSNEGARDPISIEDLERTLGELRSAVRASNPLLRAVAASRLYPILALIFGAVAVVFCFLERAAERGPAGKGLGVWAWVFLAVMLAAGGACKVVITSRIAASQGGRGFFSLFTAIFGGKAAALLVSSSAALAAGIVFLVAAGRAWYIVPLVALYTALASHGLDLLIDLPEYRIMGWTALVAGVASLFLIESDPLLWTAIVTAAIFAVFGVVGLAQDSARRKGRRQ